MNTEPDKYRLDKWLWAARFFKTRALAMQAVDGGRVSVNGQRVKPSRLLHEGDRLNITSGHDEYVVIVRQLVKRRGPASEARLLYEETEESRNARAARQEQRRLQGDAQAHPGGRPDKKSRRQIHRFLRRGSRW